MPREVIKKHGYFMVRLTVRGEGGGGVSATSTLTVGNCENFDPFFIEFWYSNHILSHCEGPQKCIFNSLMHLLYRRHPTPLTENYWKFSFKTNEGIKGLKLAFLVKNSFSCSLANSIEKKIVKIFTFVRAEVADPHPPPANLTVKRFVFLSLTLKGSGKKKKVLLQ